MKILVTGAAGFVGAYLVPELLVQGHEVIGIDDHSRYGKGKNYENKNYTFVKGNVNDTDLMKSLLKDCDYLIALAARVGGVGLFNTASYDLFADNERITISTFDAAIDAFNNHQLKKIIVLSSGMVFESTDIFPTPESAISTTPPPKTTYGFQKLATEYFAKGAWEQYKLPYTIVRPANVVGIGDSLEKMSHVIPDLTVKIVSGENPLQIKGNGKQIRHYIYAKDLAKGIIMATFSEKARNEDFNLATNVSTSVLELAELIWKKIWPDKPFAYIAEKPYAKDVPVSIPDVTKAQQLLGFTAETTLDEMLDEVVPWIKKHIDHI
jgi:nucleoside-diphosphate-sugar epimerase